MNQFCNSGADADSAMNGAPMEAANRAISQRVMPPEGGDVEALCDSERQRERDARQDGEMQHRRPSWRQHPRNDMRVEIPCE